MTDVNQTRTNPIFSAYFAATAVAAMVAPIEIKTIAITALLLTQKSAHRNYSKSVATGIVLSALGSGIWEGMKAVGGAKGAEAVLKTALSTSAAGTILALMSGLGGAIEIGLRDRTFIKEKLQILANETIKNVFNSAIDTTIATALGATIGSGIRTASIGTVGAAFGTGVLLSTAAIWIRSRTGLSQRIDPRIFISNCGVIFGAAAIGSSLLGSAGRWLLRY